MYSIISIGTEVFDGYDTIGVGTVGGVFVFSSYFRCWFDSNLDLGSFAFAGNRVITGDLTDEVGCSAVLS